MPEQMDYFLTPINDSYTPDVAASLVAAGWTQSTVWSAISVPIASLPTNEIPMMLLDEQPRFAVIWERPSCPFKAEDDDLPKPFGQPPTFERKSPSGK